MQRGSTPKATVLLLFLALLVASTFAVNPCSTCFSTYIGLTENDGVIEATAFQVNQTTLLQENLGYFDQEVRDFLSGKPVLAGQGTGLPNNQVPVSISINSSPIANAELYFSYYNRTGSKLNISECYPVIASQTKSYSYVYTDENGNRITSSKTLYYATCTIPHEFYENGSIDIFVEYRGNQTLKPSEREITVYDISAGGLNVLAKSVDDALTPLLQSGNPACLAALIMVGLLFASMYYSGKSPLSYLDITVPRTPKPKAYGFGPLIAGTGNIRLAMPTAWDSKYLDILVKRHTEIELRRLRATNPALSREIEAAIKSASGTSTKKYFALLAAGDKNRNWKDVISMDERTLVLQAEKNLWGAIPHQLLMVMKQQVAAQQVVQGMGVVGGSPFAPIKKITGYVRQVPLIGTFIGIAVGSTSFGARTAKEMAKAAASKPVRMAMGGRYQQLSKEESALEGQVEEKYRAGQKVKDADLKLGYVEKKLYDIASLTDTKKMKVGRLFQLHEYTKRFYEDTRDALYEEIVKNVIWHEVYEQLVQAHGAERAREMIDSQMDFRGALSKREVNDQFFKALQDVKIHEVYVRALADHNATSEERASKMLTALRSIGKNPNSSNFASDAGALYDLLYKLDHVAVPAKGASTPLKSTASGAAGTESLTDFERARALVNYLRRNYHIDQPHDLSGQISTGGLFVTVGRNNLYFEEGGVRKNFGLLTMGLKEYTDQIVYNADRLYKGKKAADLNTSDFEAINKQFTTADGFKLAWLKLKSQVLGHGEWMLEGADTVDTFNPATGKKSKVSFVHDVLGLTNEDIAYSNERMKIYLHELMSAAGRKKMADVGKESDSFLYSYDIQATKEKEEKTPLPWNRRQWYYLEHESYPEDKYWRADMNFIWSNIGPADKRITLLYEVRGQKFWSNVPRHEQAWQMMELFMDNRLAHIMNGTQREFFGYEQSSEQFKRFSRVDMYKAFNETWDYYSKAGEALGNLFGLKTSSHYDIVELEKKLSGKDGVVTYDMLRNSKFPFIYTHDMSYLPYVRGMAVSDFDRVVNGVFMLQEENGEQRRMFDFRKRAELKNELHNEGNGITEELRVILNKIQGVKRLPMLSELAEVLGLVDVAGISGPQRMSFTKNLSEIENLVRSGAKEPHEVEEISRLARALHEQAATVKDENIKGKLLRAVDHLDPGMLPARSLTHDELEQYKQAVARSSARAELKLEFLYEFSEITHDWKSLWTDNRAGMKFFTLVSEKEAGPPVHGGVGKFMEGAIGAENTKSVWNFIRGAMGDWVEPMIYGAGKIEANAMSNNVALSELYRERGHDMRMRIKADSDKFLEGLPDYYDKNDREMLKQDYHNYSDSFARFFTGWMDSVTRDPRGSSTQWGRQWYLATMYHRGGAMHPEHHEFGGERTFLSPLQWFVSQPFVRADSINWMLGSPFVRMMRGFQTAMYGYPTIWDKNITPSGDFDLLSPWQHVQYTNYQKVRALVSPSESVFTLQNFSFKDMFARAVHITPGLNMLPYFFPSMDKSGSYYTPGAKFSETKPGVPSPVYNALSQVPGLGSLFNQSQAQRSQRTGKELVDALKQSPEDFLQYKGGGFVQHFTDSSNPGVSYTDYSGRGRLAPRMASYLTRDFVGKGFVDQEEWRNYFGQDSYVHRQADFSLARRGISAEVKRLQFQEEFTGYGPGENPMWAPLSTPTMGYWGWKWFKSSKIATGATATLAHAVAGPLGAAAWGAATLQGGYQGYDWWTNRPKGKTVMEGIKETATRHYHEARNDVHGCMFCGTKVGRGMQCPNPRCRKYG